MRRARPDRTAPVTGSPAPAGSLRASLAVLAVLAGLDLSAAQAQMLRGRLDDKPRQPEWEERRDRAPAPRVTVPRLAEDAELDAASRVFDDGTRVDLIRDPAARTAAGATPPGTPGAAPATAAGRPGDAAGRARTARRPPPGRVTPVGPFEPAAATRPIAPVAASQPTPRDIRADERAEAEKEDDAYRPLGLRTGGMTWRPAIELSAGRSSNVDGRRDGRASTMWQIAPELVGTSDWSRHALEVSLRGAHVGYPAAAEQSKPSVRAEAKGRVDLDDLTTVELAALWSRERQSTSTAEDPTRSTEAPDLDTATASLGVTRDVGLLALTLRGGVERSDYRSRTTGGGSEIENNTRWIGTFRTTLGPQAPLRPFAEVQVSRRDYDQTLIYGQRRDSDGGRLAVGVVADMGPMLRGEIGLGWATERPIGGDLPAMNDWTADGTLTWSPTRLDKVKLEAKTAFVPTTLVGSPGAVHRTLGVTWEHALRADLVGSLGLATSTKRYAATSTSERSVTVSSGLTYKFDRNLQTFVRGTWEFAGTTGSPDYQVGTVLVGVRVQR